MTVTATNRSRLGTALVVGVLAAGAVGAAGAACTAQRDDDGAAAPRTAAPTGPTPVRSSRAPRRTDERGRIPISGGRHLVGQWDDGPLLGEAVGVGVFEGHRKVVYASRTGLGARCVSLGLLVDGRILRLLCAVVPADPTTERFVMWGGARDEADQDTTADGPHYLLVGVVPGDTEVALEGAGAASRPVTTTRTDVLPGHTVFIDRAPWDPAWDGLQLAPLTVTTGSGLSLDVRRRSYVG